jgi:hypothetical protein
VFITEDKNVKIKTKALYNFFEVPTYVLNIKEFLDNELNIINNQSNKI